MMRFLKTCNVMKRVYDSYMDAFEWVDYTVTRNEEFEEAEIGFEHLTKDEDYEVIN